MKKLSGIRCAACLCLCIALAMGGMGACALSDTDGQPNTINYAVRAILPENQRDDTAPYFDLKMTPGQEQVLEVIISNRADEAIEVMLEANTAFSNCNGVIEFDASTQRDSSMAVDFAQIVRPVEPVLVVPGQGEATARFTVRMPEAPYAGTVYGGLMFTKLHQEDAGDGGGSFGIRNVYRYVIGVRLTESETPVAPEFELHGAAIGQGKRATLLLNLRNPKPVIARGITLSMKVFPQGEDTAVIELVRSDVAMAPNSSMDYTVYLEDNTQLASGEYRVQVWLDFDGRTWQFEAPLAVE